MDKKLPEKQIQKMLSDAPPTAVEAYLRLFDRVLLHSLAVRMLGEEEKEQVLNIWSKAVLKSIDLESSQRTEFMESTPSGRAAKYNEEPDGEAIRLAYLKAYDAVKFIVKNQISQPDTDDFLGSEVD